MKYFKYPELPKCFGIRMAEDMASNDVLEV